MINKLLNALGYNPKGSRRGLPVLGLWLNHIGASVYSTQDAHGLIRRGIILTDCIALGALEATRKIDNQLGTLIDLSNFATQAGGVRLMEGRVANVRNRHRHVGRIMVMAIFTLSCFGLLLYLWSAFGGPVPLKPHGYRFQLRSRRRPSSPRRRTCASRA